MSLLFTPAPTRSAGCAHLTRFARIQVEFVSVPNLKGDMPAMTTDVSKLGGNKRADVADDVRKGVAR